jgi:hypothetical protein
MRNIVKIIAPFSINHVSEFFRVEHHRNKFSIFPKQMRQRAVSAHIFLASCWPIYRHCSGGSTGSRFERARAARVAAAANGVVTQVWWWPDDGRQSQSPKTIAEIFYQNIGQFSTRRKEHVRVEY